VFTKAGLQYAPPFTFLTLRFSFGLLCLIPVILLWKPRWPSTRAGWAHLAVVGLFMHVAQLGGSHYAQYLGMSAGVSALILSCQPLLTAFFASRFLGERLKPGQWLGVFVGLAGVALVVWHKLDIRELRFGSLLGALIALASVTMATLYQRRFAPQADLKAAAVIQFATAAAVVAPLAVAIEGFHFTSSWVLWGSITVLVIFTSLLGLSAFYYLLRHGGATRVTSMMYLPPVFAVVLEAAWFGVVPSALALAGIAVTCAGVAMTVWRPSWKSSPS
jgi:drug/metabolite transporter (DMT)-like permease